MNPRTIALSAVALALIAGCVMWFATRGDITFENKPSIAPEKKPVAIMPVKPAPVVLVPPPKAPYPPPRDRRDIDPEFQKLAERLAVHDQPPLEDLAIVNEFVELCRKSFSDLSIGSNGDLMSILTGQNKVRGVLFPTSSPMLIKGELVDRWGTPYWMHPNSGARIEIRSAGPDKNLFTPDDVILNASPRGFGATPASGAE